MTRQMLIANWYSVFPILFTALIYLIVAAIFFIFGYLLGWNKGTRAAPETLKGEWREEQHKRLIAEERLESERQISRRWQAAALNAYEARQNKQLRIVKG